MANPNCILGGPNYVDATFYTVSFSGGSWLAGLPLPNLKDPIFANATRSTNALAASTQWQTDLGAPRNVRLVAIPYIEGASKTCKVRVRGSMASGDFTSPVCDSGWTDLFPIIYPAGSLPWGHPSFWDGRMTDEDAATARMPFVAVWDDDQLARYWLIEIDDTAGNTSGYVTLPRLFICPGWQPSLNMIAGAGFGFNNDTPVETSLGGVRFYDVHPQARYGRFRFDYLPESEALASAWDMVAKIGVEKQIFYISDPTDRVNMHRRAFPATLKAPGEFDYVQAGRIGTAFDLIEVIG